MRDRHYTAWAGTLATAGELSRRGYDVALTLGNTPVFDLICHSPAGVDFTVQVKSLSYPNGVNIQKHVLEAPPREKLLFVFCLVPLDNDRPCRFFVMSHQEVRDIWAGVPKLKRDGSVPTPGREGLNWGFVKPHELRWDKLPA